MVSRKYLTDYKINRLEILGSTRKCVSTMLQRENNEGRSCCCLLGQFEKQAREGIDRLRQGVFKYAGQNLLAVPVFSISLRAWVLIR